MKTKKVHKTVNF